MYNNWGGYITGEDVRGLDIDINKGNVVYKKGACVMLCCNVMIMASGIVNGCACRDVDATLRIGDLHSQSLSELLSSRNRGYMELIEDQQKGRFPPVCRSCDFYKSIYHFRLFPSSRHLRPLTMHGFMERISRPETAGLSAASGKP